MTPKTSNSAQKRMKQSTLLSFFSKQPAPSSPSSRNKSANKADTKILTNVAVKEQKKPTNKLLFVGMEDEDSDASGFVTANDSVNSVNSVGQNIHNSKSDSDQTPTVAEDDGDKTLSSVSAVNLDRKQQEIDGDDDEEGNTLSSSGRRLRKNLSYAEDSDNSDNESTPSVSRKKRKMQIELDDEEEEYVPDKKDESEDDLVEEDGDDDLLALAESSSPKPEKTVLKHTPSRPKKPFAVKRSPSIRPLSTPKHQKFGKQNEERYHWLVDERDASGRPITDPQYDPRTLYIPSSAWNKFTPFEKQYWEIKSKMWDCIVFFKKGKFFELYEKDAMLGNHLFDLKIAGGGRANMQLAGIPEMSFDYWASQFIQRGYKVAKVDQRESMLAKEMREGSKGIVKRELQYVLTSGTLTEGNMLQSDLATYCLAVREESGNFYDLENDNQSPGVAPKRLFGVAFIDTATGELNLIEFEDDDECTKLDTIMSQVNPKEVIMEKDNLSSLAHKIIKFNAAPQAIYNYIKPDTEFYGYDKTSKELDDSKYFPDKNQWPAILKKYYEQGKKIGFSAFGGLLYYLQWLKLDESLISMGNVKEYNPTRFQNSLVMDGVTLQNLEIFTNSFDGTDKGTLFKLFNKAISPMGKRMMKKWLMHPLLKQKDINKRLDTVESLMSDGNLRDLLESTFAKLPDLERTLSRVHSGNLKVKDFDKTIQGFEAVVDLLQKMSSHSLEGSLSDYVSSIPKSLFVDVENWSNAFDREKAVDEGILLPHRGVEPEFDESVDKIKELEDQLEDLLKAYKQQFKCSNLQYKDCGKEIYTIEVPVSASKHIPSNWVQMAANKSTKRYYSDEVRVLARSVAEARELHKVLEEELRTRLCKKFDIHYGTSWMPTVQAIASIDCLLALVRTSESLSFPYCRPTLVDELDHETGAKLNGFLKFKSLRHPCFNLGTTTSKDFIPNDVELGKDCPQLGLLTGANAAGKSTVLRMTCIAVIMAQMGCYVPCESAILTPMDRIMTRLGASDNIMQGKSTFFVELSETKKILDLATNRSLLVLDELGRGGSSSDGFAIAEGVLHHVATHIQSLGFFATHYASLGQSFRGHPQVRPLKMSIMVDEKTRTVAFLYKLVDGQSEGSFGMHVASMCGIAEEIVDNAQVAAASMEHTSQLMKERAKESNALAVGDSSLPLGLESDFVRLVFGDGLKNSKLGTGEAVQVYDSHVKGKTLANLFSMIESLNE